MHVAWVTSVKIDPDSGLDVAMDEFRESGGWILTMASGLMSDVRISKLSIISVNSSNKSFEKDFKDLKVFAIKENPMNFLSKHKIIDRVEDVINKIKPDIIDVQGIEFMFSNVKTQRCIVRTIQGLPSELIKYQKMQNLGLKSIEYASFISLFTLRNFWIQNLFLAKRANLSKKILLKGGHFIGRTDWDRAIVQNTNLTSSYHKVNRILRPDFYKEIWDISKVQKNAIFTINFSSLNKGFDVFIDSVEILVKYIPNLIVYVPGNINNKIITGKWYDRYISAKIKRKNLEKNFVFLGSLNAAEMVKYLLISKVFVSPSLNENSSNAIAEAQLIGIPVVAAFTGGNSTYIKHEKTGLMYSPWDPYMCACAVLQFMNSDDLCMQVSQNEHKVASERHNRNDAVKELVKAYIDIIERS